MRLIGIALKEAGRERVPALEIKKMRQHLDNLAVHSVRERDAHSQQQGDPTSQKAHGRQDNVPAGHDNRICVQRPVRASAAH
ncbi:MAG: hypothetical protein EBS84_00285 [Proteobacteria bacterium]|nr:hypothetical protein [Pseudomonadota bacterium]